MDTLFSPVQGCRIELRPDRERVLVLLDGELDLAAVELVDRELEGLRWAGWRQIVLDLGAVNFMDLAGVRLLLGAFERADRAGDLFAVVTASPQVCRILELTGNDQLLAGLEWRNTAEDGQKRLLRGQAGRRSSAGSVLTMQAGREAGRARVPAPDQEST